MASVTPIVVVALLALFATGHARPTGSPYPSSKYPTGTTPLLVVADSKLSTSQVVALQTLSGCLARTTPQIYRVSNDPSDPADSYALWLRTMQSEYKVAIDTTYLNNFHGLLGHFAKNISGYTVYNGSTESLNAAATYSAGTPGNNAVVAVDSTDADTLGVLKDLGLTLIADLTQANVSDVYASKRANFGNRVVSFMPPSKATELIEYAVFAAAPTMEYQGDTGGPLANTIMADIGAAGPNGVAMGWGPEGPYVATLSKHSIYVHASDFAHDVGSLTNLHVHANVQRKTQTATRSPAPASRTGASTNGNVHTVAFLMTDGDNIQWMLNDWATASNWYNSTSRGQVPVGWTISPALAALAPAMLDYTYAHATSNDSFVTGPSGVGYTNPDTFADMQSFAALTGAYMNASDLRIVNTIDASDSFDAVETLTALPNADAVFLYSGSCYAGPAGKTGWSNGKPIFTGRAALWGNGTTGQCLGVQPLVQRLASLPKDQTDANGYSLIPVHAWTHPLADVAAAAKLLQEAGGFDVVTPTELVSRFTANIKPSQR